MANLCHYRPPQENPKIAATIEALIQKRRGKHIATLEAFEKKEKDFLKDVENSLMGCSNGIKSYLAQNL